MPKQTNECKVLSRTMTRTRYGRKVEFTARSEKGLLPGDVVVHPRRNGASEWLIVSGQYAEGAEHSYYNCKPYG